MNRREWLIYSPIYFFLSLTDLILKLRLTPAWTDGRLADSHRQLMAFSYYNNEQSRFLQYLLPELLNRLGLSIESSYALLRLVFVFLALLMFHYFLREWFNPAESFAGALILSGAMAVAFLIDDTQESAPLLMLLFVLGLWAMREEKDVLFCLFLLLGGGLTNETMLVMPIGYFFFRLRSKQPLDILKTAFRTGLIALPAFLTQGTIRYLTRFQPHLGPGLQLPYNIGGIWKEFSDPRFALFEGIYIYPFLIFSIFWIWAYFGFFKSPRFLRCVSWIIPFFFAGNLITGIIRESRQMIPLGFIIIPLALFFIFPEARIRLLRAASQEIGQGE
jgi:hypothetical protein